MNKTRRDALAKLLEEIQALQGKAEDLYSELESIKDEEQEVYDNMPESFQNGEKGEKVTAAVDAMEEALSELETFKDMDFSSYFETAAE